jgi:hypothetical protein
MSWPFEWNHETRVEAARKAILPLLIEDGQEPDRNGTGPTDVWLIPMTKADAALMLDEIAEAAVNAQRYPLP